MAVALQKDKRSNQTTIFAFYQARRIAASVADVENMLEFGINYRCEINPQTKRKQQGPEALFGGR